MFTLCRSCSSSISASPSSIFASSSSTFALRLQSSSSSSPSSLRFNLSISSLSTRHTQPSNPVALANLQRLSHC
nr:hypothetical protein CFP56_57428 [Quercus suber]